jgi:hypothetical protein
MASLDTKILSRWRVKVSLHRINVLFENVVWETTGEIKLCCAMSQKAIQAQSSKSQIVRFVFIEVYALINMLLSDTIF